MKQLIEEFWERHQQSPISAQATSLFFYFLSRISKTGEESVVMSNREISIALGLSRTRIAKYQLELNQGNFLYCSSLEKGYGYLYATVPNGTHDCPKMSHRLSQNEPPCPKRDSRLSQTGHMTVPKGATLSQNEPPCIEVEEVEIVEEISEYSIKQRQAAGEGQAVLKAFFNSSNRATHESFCMRYHISLEDLARIATDVVNGWSIDGTCHTDYAGNFNLNDALRHLRMTIPKVVEGNKKKVRTRQDSRQELLDSMAESMYRIQNNLVTEKQEERPF